MSNHLINTDGSLLFDIHCPYCISIKVHPTQPQGKVYQEILEDKVALQDKN